MHIISDKDFKKSQNPWASLYTSHIKLLYILGPVPVLATSIQVNWENRIALHTTDFVCMPAFLFMHIHSYKGPSKVNS